MEQCPLASAEWRLHLIIGLFQNQLKEGPIQTDHPQIVIQLVFLADIVKKPALPVRKGEAKQTRWLEPASPVTHTRRLMKQPTAPYGSPRMERERRK